jgi:hypothetical protein
MTLPNSQGNQSFRTKYFAETSSINFRRSVYSDFGGLGTALSFRRVRWGFDWCRRFERENR